MVNPAERLRKLVGRSDTTPEARQAELDKVQRRAKAEAVRQDHKRQANPRDSGSSGITPGGGSY
jgi:hypothetical protein